MRISSLLTASLFCSVAITVGQPVRAELPEPKAALLKQGNVRVIVVGDSITGLSRNYASGFAHQMDWALKATYGDCHPDLVALGGSGQGVASWLATEKRARSAQLFLDVKGIEVKAALDQPADVLVVMLGMNDVLAPYVADEPASLQRWADNYRALIQALKQRVQPRTVALATVTMATEDPTSPKNRLVGRLNARVQKLAEELKCRVLSTNEMVYDVLRQGRRLRPDFHVTYDFVHPNEAGHLAIAIAMLRGLGEEAAAKRLADERLAAVLRKAAGDGPTLSYELTPLDGPLGSDRQSYRLHYSWTARAGQTGGTVRVQLDAPEWKVKPASTQAAEGEFLVTGVPDHRATVLMLRGSDGEATVTREVRISPPWLVTTGLVQPFWSAMKFDPTRARTPLDEVIERGGDFTVPLEAGRHPGLQWKRYSPSINYTGLDAAGSVDFAAITHAQNFEAGYAARWIQSSRERRVRVLLGSQTFAGALHLTVFLNGREIYRGHITSEPRKQKAIDARLRKGWNTLVIKANHCSWQWQCSADIAGVGEDSLGDLRYSTVPGP